MVAQPHPRWDERPVALVVLSEGSAISKEAILAHCAKTFAKWQLPDDLLFVQEIPLTGTGKLDKKTIRARLQEEGYQEVQAIRARLLEELSPKVISSPSC